MMTGANYSTTSEEMLCKTCKFGQVVESSSGGTAVMCHCQLNGAENAIPQRLQMLVTKCNRYEHPQLLRIWDTAVSLTMEDGHCWLGSSHYIPALGHVHQRADTVGKRHWIFQEYPSRVWDSDEHHFTDEPKPVGHSVARWWKRLRQ